MLFVNIIIYMCPTNAKLIYKHSTAEIINVDIFFESVVHIFVFIVSICLYKKWVFWLFNQLFTFTKYWKMPLSLSTFELLKRDWNYCFDFFNTIRLKNSKYWIFTDRKKVILEKNL